MRLRTGVDQTRVSEPFTCRTTGEPSSPSLWNATFTRQQEAKQTSPPSPHSGVSTWPACSQRVRSHTLIHSNTDITLRMDSDCFATKTEAKSSRWHELERYCAVSLCVFQAENVNVLFLLALQMVWWRPWSPLTRALNGRRCALHRAASVTLRPRLTGPREWETHTPLSDFFHLCHYDFSWLNYSVFTVQTSHPRFLQHNHEDECSDVASFTAQRSGSHSGSW